MNRRWINHSKKLLSTDIYIKKRANYSLMLHIDILDYPSHIQTVIPLTGKYIYSGVVLQLSIRLSMYNKKYRGDDPVRLQHGNDHIVRFKSGKVWHFFSRKGFGIHYRRLDQNHGWQNSMQLIPDAQDYFSLSVDRNDMLHLVFQDHDGQIQYMIYNGKNWDKQMIARYDSSEYIARSVSVVTFNERVHVFFSVGSNPPSDGWKIHHCHFHEGKWIDDEITGYTTHNQPSPLYFDFSKRNLHMIYRGIYYGKYQLFHCRLDNSLNRWSKPERITRSQTDCISPSLLVHGNKIHLAWAYVKNANLQIKYTGWNYNQYYKKGDESDILLSNNESNCMYPQLLQADNRLWCLWYQNNDIYCCSSSDDGITWTGAKPIGWSDYKQCCCIRYCSNFPEDLAAFKVHRIFANLDTGLELPVIGEYSSFPAKVPDLNIKPYEQAQKNTLPPLQQEKSRKTSSEISPAKVGNASSQTENTSPQEGITPSKPESEAAAAIQTEEQANSIIDLYEPEKLLNSWFKKAEEVQAQNQVIMREIETLRRRSIEIKRQWEILRQDFVELKYLLSKQNKKGLLSRLLGRNLTN